jgi:hypothetical protein
VLCSSQDHLRTRTPNIDQPVLVSAKNTDSCHTRKRDLLRVFPLYVSMVPSSAVVITVDGEHLTCGGFSLGEIVRLGNFKFIVNYFRVLSLSPKRGDTGVAFMGSTYSGASTPRRAMTGDSAEEFLMVPRGEGSFGLPSPRWHGIGALLAPVTTTPQMENTPAAQATTMVLLWMATPRPETDLPSV